MRLSVFGMAGLMLAVSPLATTAMAQPAEAQSVRTANPTKFHIVDGFPLTVIEVEGVRVPASIDTGLETSEIEAGFAEHLSLSPDERDIVRLSEGRIAATSLPAFEAVIATVNRTNRELRLGIAALPSRVALDGPSGEVTLGEAVAEPTGPTRPFLANEGVMMPTLEVELAGTPFSAVVSTSGDQPLILPASWMGRISLANAPEILGQMNHSDGSKSDYYESEGPVTLLVEGQEIDIEGIGFAGIEVPVLGGETLSQLRFAWDSEKRISWGLRP